MRILITGSTQGLGRATAESLLARGHRVVAHARDESRVDALHGLVAQGADVVVGDLAETAQTRAVADQVNRLGRMDAIIHNAGVYDTRRPLRTSAGHPRTLAVNVLAPYLLTALIEPPRRLIYVSSGMHRGGVPSVDDLDWRTRPWDGTQAYCDSKLLVTTLAFAIARRRPDVVVSSVDPGWVPTRMGGRSAPDSLESGHLTQGWLATSEEPAHLATGRHWHHQRSIRAAAAAGDPAFQERLLDALADLTGVAIA